MVAWQRLSLQGGLWQLSQHANNDVDMAANSSMQTPHLKSESAVTRRRSSHLAH